MRAWILLLLAPLSAAASPSPTELARSAEWLHLLHYQSSLIGEKSTADGRDFFLSPEGKLNAEKELLATLAAFRNGASASPVGALKQIPLCAFPARRHFLEEKTGENFAAVPCKEYDDWKTGLSAEKAVYVFSSAYPNNPAAMFGHTLLRLEKPGAAGRTNLLNYGVAFSANIPTGIDDFRYGLYGLLGGFSGFFSLAPYYTMANDYNNSEIRDLWEYPLRLNPSQVNRMVDHLWELYTTTNFDYFFFTENCTTQLLALIQVAIPDVDIFKGLPWYILPLDSIHRLKELELIAEPVHRPSVKKKLAATEKTLTGPEEKEYFALINGKAELSAVQSIAVLDAAAAYWNYKKFLNKKLTNSPEQAELHKILLHRASLGMLPARSVSYDATSRPDLGHFSAATWLGYGYRNEESRLRLGYRLGVHDLLDSQFGFEPTAQIEFLSGTIAYLPARKKFRAEEFKLFEVTSLFPWDNYDKKLSWTLSARSEPVQKIACDTCRRELFEGGAGISAKVSDKGLLYSLALARAGWDSREKWDMGFGTQSGLLLRFRPNHSARLEARGEFDFFKGFGKKWFWDYSYTHAYTFNQKWELRGNFDFIPRVGESEKAGGLKVLRFF